MIEQSNSTNSNELVLKKLVQNPKNKHSYVHVQLSHLICNDINNILIVNASVYRSGA